MAFAFFEKAITRSPIFNSEIKTFSPASKVTDSEPAKQELLLEDELLPGADVGVIVGSDVGIVGIVGAIVRIDVGAIVGGDVGSDVGANVGAGLVHV
jgi:hypothetical protein